MCSGSVVRMKKSLVAFSRGGELLEADGVPVAQLPRRDAEPLGRLGHRLAVLVGAGEEEDVLAALPHVPREHVGRDRRVRVPQVGLPVHVVDGRRDVVRHAPSKLPRRPRPRRRRARGQPSSAMRHRGGPPGPRPFLKASVSAERAGASSGAAAGERPAESVWRSRRASPRPGERAAERAPGARGRPGRSGRSSRRRAAAALRSWRVKRRGRGRGRDWRRPGSASRRCAGAAPSAAGWRGSGVAVRPAPAAGARGTGAGAGTRAGAAGHPTAAGAGRGARAGGAGRPRRALGRSGLGGSGTGAAPARALGAALARRRRQEASGSR